MKVLIPYDGTKNAENALLDLQNAGFGQDDEVLIVITDIWLPESAEEYFRAVKERRLKLEKSGTCSYAPAQSRFEEKIFLAREIISRLSSTFPALNIKIGTLPGDNLVSSELLEKAARWKADLIILGSGESEDNSVNNGYKSGLWRVVAEAECSVRLARNTNRRNFAINPDSPNRIIAVLSGLKTDAKVTEAVARRRWSADSTVRVIKVNQQIFPEKEKLSSRSSKIVPFKLKASKYINSSPPENKNFSLNAEAKLLETAGLIVSTAILKINAPLFLLSREISDWKPDCVFIADPESSIGKQKSEGQKALDDIAGRLLRQAAFSVEIVRSTGKNKKIPKIEAREKQQNEQREIKNSPTAAAISF